MATRDIYVLSSSPPKIISARLTMSSSPSRSPSVIVRKDALDSCTGSHTAPIPKGAAGFTSAATLLSENLADGLGLTGPNTEQGAREVAEEPRSTKLKRVPKSITEKLGQFGSGETVEDDPFPIIHDTAADNAPKLTGTTAASAILSKGKAVRKPRTKKTEGVAVTAKDKAPRIPSAKKGGANIAVEEKEKTVRKPRVRKTGENLQPKLATGQITKASNGKSTKANPTRRKKTVEVSKHFESIPCDDDNKSLQLEAAVKRRTDWTPPASVNNLTAWVTTPVPINFQDSELDSGGSPASEEKPRNIGDLLSNFSFTKTTHPTSTKIIEGAGTRKRKLIELVSLKESATAAIPVAQNKAVKKKPRTITDLATAAYDVTDGDNEAAHPAPLLQYFNLDGSSCRDGYKLPSKSRNRSPDKTGARKAKGKKSPEIILLSPESALKEANKQDYVFGTSSQLARDESPTFLRELHQALQESNQAIDDPFSESFEEVICESASLSVVNPRKSVLPVVTKRNLWSAASRDKDGKILEVETIDLSKSPISECEAQCDAITSTEMPLLPSNTLDTQAIQQITESARPAMICTSVESSSGLDEPPEDIGTGTVDGAIVTFTGPIDDEAWHDQTATSLIHESHSRASNAVGPIEAAIRLELRDPAQPRRQRSPSLAKAATSTKKRGRKPKAVNDEMPDYSVYTDAQLAREIALYHFKPIKKRSVMIDLLAQCWEGKQRLASKSIANARVSASPTRDRKTTAILTSEDCTVSVLPPKKPQGRPRKDTTVPTVAPLLESKSRIQSRASKAAENLDFDSDAPLSQLRTPDESQKDIQAIIDEIYDSDPALTPSPPRRPASQIRTPPIPLQLSASTDVESSPVLSPASSQTLLHQYISKAVKAAPRSKMAQHPSWHEKILLYDPIVLEDLTVWLNTGSLEKVGWDGEVAPSEVKKWCESKSICCLWQENLRGGTRSRY